MAMPNLPDVLPGVPGAAIAMLHTRDLIVSRRVAAAAVAREYALFKGDVEAMLPNVPGRDDIRVPHVMDNLLTGVLTLLWAPPT